MKLNNFTLIFKSILLLLLFIGCSKDSDIVNNTDPDPIVEEEETFNYTSSAKYNLNIIYFLPKGSEERKESHKRLSEILLQGQEFFKQQMTINGFGDKTFNLLIDNEKTRIKIDYIEGGFSASHYPYDGGGNLMIPEIEAYYASNPDKNTSDHYLVLSPVADINNANVPYYGLGKWCFAADYDDMDIKHLGTGTNLGIKATTYIGGLLHELGHGLNLPHNKEKVSDFSNSNKGTALMGSGNYTYGKEPTFITKASCAILNNNQIFSNSSDLFYEGATAVVENFQASYENGSIKFSGTVTSDIPVNYIGFYNDPADDNFDYDAVTWATSVDGNNAFSMDMPISELHKKGNTAYALRLRLNHTSGDITSLSYFYKFVNDIPIIEFGEQNYLDRANWSIASYSSQEDNGGEGSTGRATDILDGDHLTYWHSCWQGCSDSYPHSITVNTGETTTVKGFTFIQRNALSRSIKDIEILVSDDNQTWSSLGNFTLNNVNTAQNITLNNQTSFKYFKIEAKTAHDGQQWASLAEVMCF